MSYNEKGLSITLAQTSVVSVVLVTLGVPRVVVARGQMDVGLISAVVNKVIICKRCPRVPPILAITSPVAPGPVMARVPIAWCILIDHVEPKALHSVHIQDVSEAEGVAQLYGVGEVGAVVPALGPVHHQGVGGGEGLVPALSAPVGRGRGALDIRENFSFQTHAFSSRFAGGKGN